jgi:hypothetical protein
VSLVAPLSEVSPVSSVRTSSSGDAVSRPASAHADFAQSGPEGAFDWSPEQAGKEAMATTIVNQVELQKDK